MESRDPSPGDSPSGPASDKQRVRKHVRRRKRREKPPSLDMPGVGRVVLSDRTQHEIQLTVGVDVTAERPWKYVQKELIDDELDIREDDSEFFQFGDEIKQFPRKDVLMGFIPDETRDYDEFYICLTENAQDAVEKIIQKMQDEQEERLKTSIYKNVKPWHTLGSEVEVELAHERANRPLLEVEVESSYPIMSPKVRFKTRLVDEARDGYAAILCTRFAEEQLAMKQIDQGVQVTPAVTQNEAQTTCSYPKNVWTQYKYEYEQVTKLGPEIEKDFRDYVEREMEDLTDKIYVNSYIDFYTDDYANLVKDEKFTKPPAKVYGKEYTSFADVVACKGLMIGAVAWHPMWTGTVAISYTAIAPTAYHKRQPVDDEPNRLVHKKHPVLLWSLTDALNAKLYLDTPREVTALSFCPFDENILVGGCLNGLVIIWDIKNKLKNVEEHEVLTSVQQKYRNLMFSLMRWMKNTKNDALVEPTVVSELPYSHTQAVTGIQWISPYWAVSKTGKLWETTDEDSTTMQFMTSSRDGTVLFWDLFSTPKAQPGSYKPQRRLRRLKQRPSALTVDVSPFRVLNRIFKPTYKVTVSPAQNGNKLCPLTSLSFETPVVVYKEVKPDPGLKFNVMNRILHKPVVQRPHNRLEQTIVTISTHGHFIAGTWEGFDFDSGEILNKEELKTKNIAKYHDGPVVCISRSPYFDDVYLTVGGKVFAIWKEDFKGQPVIWRRSKTKYTYCCWFKYRPSSFVLLTSRGNKEIWSWLRRSDQAVTVQPISGNLLTGFYNHPLSMEQDVSGVCDANGSFRIFYNPKAHSKPLPNEKAQMKNLLDREVNRKTKLAEWQEEWVNRYASWIRSAREQVELEAKLKLEEEKQAKEREELEKEMREKELEKEALKAKQQAPSEFTKWAHEKWLKSEEDRMYTLLMSKRCLDKELLEKQQAPLKKQQREDTKKKVKLEERTKAGPKIFDDTVSMMFPDAVKEKPSPPEDPYAGEESEDVKKSYSDHFSQICEYARDYINRRPYKSAFNWLNTLNEGRKRRRIMDEMFSGSMHRKRFAEEQKLRDEDELTSYAKQTWGRKSKAQPAVEEEIQLQQLDLEEEEEEENEDTIGVGVEEKGALIDEEILQEPVGEEQQLPE